MPEEELDNKFRLNQARRETAENRLNKADGINSGMSDAEKSKRREKLYGKDYDGNEAKKHSGKFAKILVPLAVAKKAKDIATAPTEIQAMDVPIYGIALALALFKDLLDLAFIGSLPAVGTVITFCVSIAIGFVLLFDGVSSVQRKVARRLARRYLVLIAGTMAEGILFGLNFLPFETLVVVIIYWMSLVDRKETLRLNQQNQEED